MAHEEVLAFIEELELIVEELRKKWMPAPTATDMEYGWAAVERRHRFNAEQEQIREKNIREHALEILKARNKKENTDGL